MCSSDHYLEADFTKKTAGPAHQLESAYDSHNARTLVKVWAAVNFGQFPLLIFFGTWHQKVQYAPDSTTPLGLCYSQYVKAATAMSAEGLHFSAFH